MDPSVDGNPSPWNWMFTGFNCMQNDYYTLTEDSTTGYYTGSWTENADPRNWGSCDFAYTQYTKAFLLQGAVMFWGAYTFGMGFIWYNYKSSKEKNEGVAY